MNTSTRLPALILGVLAAALYLPLLPDAPTAALDSSWRLGLALACEQRLVFGVDVVFTFGPLGCLVTWQYWPATYLPAIGFWFLVGGAAAWLALEAAQGLAERLRNVAAFSLLALTPDSALLALPIAFVLHGWRTQRMSAAAWFGCAALGPLALTKFTLLPVALLALLCGLGLRLLGWRTPVAVLLAIGAGAAALAAASQPWQAIVPYVANALEVSRHYPEAMQWPASPGSVPFAPLAAAVLLVAAVAFVAIAILQELRASTAGSVAKLALALFTLALLALLVRHGTTRGDAPHLFPAFISLAALLLMYYPTLGTRLRSAAALALGPMLLVPLMMQDRAAVNIPGGSVLHRVWLSIEGAALVVTGNDPRRRLDAAVADLAGAMRARVGPAWPAHDTVDVISYDQYLLLAGDPALWRPRPVFQSYSAYSPALALLNASFLRSDRAPQALVVAAQTIDGRLASLDDAALWQLLRSDYRLTGRLGTGHLVLSRREIRLADASVRMQAVAEVDAADWVDVPGDPGAGLYASAYVERGIGQRLQAVMWKPPLRFLEVRMASGDLCKFRLVSTVAEAGFLLSPLIADTAALERWLREESTDRDRPVAIRVVNASGGPLRVTYRFGPSPYLLQ